ncbi:MAG: hypothetical protein JNG88_06105, partial [Phycisphaerales bacterium]|nr:hypothetical protein [Phycisphaerales bacterium]
VQRRETTANREVQLEELMPNDPLIEGTTPLDAEPERLIPGTPLIQEDDAPGDGQLNSYVTVYEVLANRRVFSGGEWTDAPGDLICTILAATLAEGANCPSQYRPIVTMQPLSTSAGLDGRATFEAAAEGPVSYGDVFYSWRHEGVEMPGEDNPILEIDPVHMSDAGTYEMVARNDCGAVYSQVVTLTILPSPADMNCDAEINNFDIDPFVQALIDRDVYAAQFPECNIQNGDVNGDGFVNNFDIDPFVAALIGG